MLFFVIIATTVRADPDKVDRWGKWDENVFFRVANKIFISAGGGGCE